MHEDLTPDADIQLFAEALCRSVGRYAASYAWERALDLRDLGDEAGYQNARTRRLRFPRSACAWRQNCGAWAGGSLKVIYVEHSPLQLDRASSEAPSFIALHASLAPSAIERRLEDREHTVGRCPTSPFRFSRVGMRRPLVRSLAGFGASTGRGRRKLFMPIADFRVESFATSMPPSAGSMCRSEAALVTRWPFRCVSDHAKYSRMASATVYGPVAAGSSPAAVCAYRCRCQQFQRVVRQSAVWPA
jgi:hypothetical protein